MLPSHVHPVNVVSSDSELRNVRDHHQCRLSGPSPDRNNSLILAIIHSFPVSQTGRQTAAQPSKRHAPLNLSCFDKGRELEHLAPDRAPKEALRQPPTEAA